MARLVAFTSISGIWPGIKGEALLQAKPYLREVILQRETIPDPLAYPFSIPALRALERVEFHPDVTFIAGDNGTGKSTLIEAIAMKLGFSQEGGTRNMQVQTAHTVSGLSEHLKLIRSFARPSDGYFFRAESLYNVATYMDQDDRDKYHLRAYDNLSMHKRSHGELFFTTLTKKFHGDGLYILDEPEAALSPNRQLAALTAIHELVKDNSQFIIATHSPILLAYPRAKILLLDEEGIREVAYTETEHYEVTKNFLNKYESMLEILLEPQMEIPFE
jgi:predicted ATPase